MNRARLGFIAAVASGLAAGGCASGGGGGGGATGGEFEGYAPSDNTHTRTAQFALLQAGAAEDGGEARYREALAAATTSIGQEADNPLGYMLAGQAQIGLDDYVAADSLFDKALDLYPAYAEDIRIERERAWVETFNAAIPPIDAGELEEGIRMLEKAEMIFGRQYPEALINLGMTYNMAGRTDDAIDAFGAALDIMRNPPHEDLDSARVAGWAEREWSVAFNRAQLLGQAERYDEALAEYETYLSDRPDDAVALTNMAALLVQSGMQDSAQAIYGLLESADLELRELMNVGTGLYTSEEFEQAADAFRRIAEISPDSRDAVLNLGLSLLEAEAWDELLAVGERLVEIDPFNPYSYRLHGQALVRTGAEQEAVTVLERGEDLEFHLDHPQLVPRSGGGGTVTFQFINKSLDRGTTVDVRVHFLGDDGAKIGHVDVRVTASEADVVEEHPADLTSSEGVTGYYLEVLNR